MTSFPHSACGTRSPVQLLLPGILFAPIFLFFVSRLTESESLERKIVQFQFFPRALSTTLSDLRAFIYCHSRRPSASQLGIIRVDDADNNRVPSSGQTFFHGALSPDVFYFLEQESILVS